MTGYEFTKKWFNYAYDQPEAKPVHSTLYFWCVELCNRLEWPESFGLPTDQTMEIIGVKNYKTYKKALDDLEKWNFILVVERSRNQYTATKIALVKNTKASTKASTKALSKAITKANPVEEEWSGKKHQSIVQSNVHSTVQSIVDIIKPIKPVKPLKPLKQLIERLVALDGLYEKLVYFNKNFDQIVEQLEGGVKTQKKESEEYTGCIDIYWKWYQKMNNGSKPKISAVGGKKMKSIISWIKQQDGIKTAQDVIDAWDDLLNEKWILLKGERGNFLYSKMDLKDIDSNINEVVSIISQKQNKRHGAIKKKDERPNWVD